MNKPWNVVLLLAGIFLAGGVTGAFVMMSVGRDVLARRPGPEQWAPIHLKHLAERLDLKPEQVEVLRPIIKRNMEELNRLRSYSMAETKSAFERMEREVADKLTAEQRTKYDQMNKEFRERAAKRIGPGGPGGPGGPRGDRGDRDRPPGEPGKAPGDKAPPPDKPPGN